MIVQGILSLGEPQVVQGGLQQQVRPKDERDLDIGAEHQDHIHLWTRPSTPKESWKETPNPSGVSSIDMLVGILGNFAPI